MLTKKQVDEIGGHLSRAQNPLFFFDNDQDGLCSFLLLRRYIGRGKGVPIKSFPDLIIDYFRKIDELNSDYIFILDKPVVSKEFFQEARKRNIPVVWIDHHTTDKSAVPEFVSYYNPLFNRKKSDEPVTALCWQVTKNQRREDLWLAVVGCIADRYIPEFYSDFRERYPDLSIKERDAFDIFYKSQIGKIANLFGFGLKDRTTNVINMLRFLMKAKTPYDVLEENRANRGMHHRYKEINQKYQKLLTKAMLIGKSQKKILFFQYGGDLSISRELSNELIYRFPDKIIVVAYFKGTHVNVSIRGKGALEAFSKAIKGMKDVTGGGHEEAVGGRMRSEDVETFKENLERSID